MRRALTNQNPTRIATKPPAPGYGLVVQVISAGGTVFFSNDPAGLQDVDIANVPIGGWALNSARGPFPIYPYNEDLWARPVTDGTVIEVTAYQGAANAPFPLVADEQVVGSSPLDGLDAVVLGVVGFFQNLLNRARDVRPQNEDF